MDNCPLNRTPTEAQKKTGRKLQKFQYTHQPGSTLTTTFIFEGFKLIKPRPPKPEEKDDRQRPTPHATTIYTFTQHTDLLTHETHQNESEDDLFEI